MTGLCIHTEMFYLTGFSFHSTFTYFVLVGKVRCVTFICIEQLVQYFRHQLMLFIMNATIKGLYLFITDTLNYCSVL